MSTTTLYGKLFSEATSEYTKQTGALKKHADLINHFGEAMTPFELEPHARAGTDGSASLVAVSKRGRSADALFKALSAQGYHIGQSVKTPSQFTDGYVMWTTHITGNSLQFSLLFYTEVEVA